MTSATTPTTSSAGSGVGAAFMIEGRLVEDGGAVRLTIRGGIVASIARIDEAADDVWVGPGWIDRQINGFVRHDPNGPNATPDVVAAMVRAMWRTGVAAT